MLDLEKKVLYKAFGLRFSSDIPLPELQRLTGLGTTEDISIAVADLTGSWLQAADPDKNFAVTENRVMFLIPDAAIFSIEDGSRIFVSPVKGADASKIRLYILGSCMGALLMQRRIYPLHGSVVSIDGKAYAFVGDSGAGKSTLASAFLGQGYRLLTDDVIAVTFSQDGIPMVVPAYPQQKLWQESLSHFGMKSSRYKPIFQRETKFSVPVESSFTDEPLPLAGIFELLISGQDRIEVEPIRRLEGLHVLLRHTYRKFLLSRLGLMEWHFSTTAGILKHISLYRAARPAFGFTANPLAASILKSIRGKSE